MAEYGALALDTTPLDVPSGEGDGEGEGESAPAQGGQQTNCECSRENEIASASLTKIESTRGFGVALCEYPIASGCWGNILLGTTPVKLGREISAWAVEESETRYPFLHWSAPGTLLYMSTEPGTDFTHVGEVTVVAREVPWSSVKVTESFGILNVTVANIVCQPMGKRAGAVKEKEFPPPEDGWRIWEGPGDAIMHVKAVPVAPYTENFVESWRCNPGPTGIPLTYSFGSEAHFRLSECLEIAPHSSVPDELFGHSVSASGGGQALAGMNGAAPFPGGASGEPGVSVRINATPYLGFEFVRWFLTPDPGAFLSLCSEFCHNYGEALAAHAIFRQKPTLDFVITGLGANDPAPCIGYCTADVARAYYQTDEVVEITAHAQPGYHFLRWKEEGSGVAYRNATCNAASQCQGSLDADDDEVAEYVRTNPIYIKMTADRTLEAVFVNCLHCGLRNGTTEETYGSLQGDAQLGTPTGVGRYGTDRDADVGYDDWGCDYYIHTRMRGLGSTWHTSHSTWPGLLYNDISNADGVNWRPDHNHHQNGLDIDVAYLTATGLRAWAGTTGYDQTTTEELIGLFLEDETVLVVLVDSSTQMRRADSPLDTTRIRYATGHADHFHVAFRNPNNPNDDPWN